MRSVETKRCIRYIMGRTQLYLDDELWDVLHSRARSAATTVSELVRTAVRERYLGDFQKRQIAMQAIIGMRQDRSEFVDSEEYVRKLRHGTRVEIVGKK